MSRQPALNRYIAHAALCLAMSVSVTLAEGTESLGVPEIPLQSGTAVVGGGTGLFVQPGTITVDVPAGAVVKQALLYWNGFHVTAESGADSEILVEGISVEGTLIGDPSFFFADNHSSSYRADITALGLVQSATAPCTPARAATSRPSRDPASRMVMWVPFGLAYNRWHFFCIGWYYIMLGKILKVEILWLFLNRLFLSVQTKFCFDCSPFDYSAK